MDKTKKQVIVRMTADTMIKTLEFRGGGGGQHSPAGPQPFSGPSGMTHMLGQMPDAEFQDLKAGGAVTVTSTKGAQTGHVTAILVVNNAGPMVQMIGAASGGHGVDAMHAGIISAEGLNFPGMIQ